MNSEVIKCDAVSLVVKTTGYDGRTYSIREFFSHTDVYTVQGHDDVTPSNRRWRISDAGQVEWTEIEKEQWDTIFTRKRQDNVEITEFVISWLIETGLNL